MADTFKPGPSGSEGTEHQVIHVPNMLRAKVGPGAGMDPNLIRKAERAVAEMADDFRDWAADDLARLTELTETIVDNDHRLTAHFSEIFDVAHNLKGQGGTFGYTLLSHVGDNLCRFVESLDEPSLADQPLIDAHVDAMRSILRFDVRGDDDPTGRAIVESLRLLIRRARR